jgi:hypothetical protein
MRPNRLRRPSRGTPVPTLTRPTALRFAAALSLVVTLGGIGCANLTVMPSSPTPAAAISQARAPSTLVLAQGIANDFVTPQANGVTEVPVKGWRDTLTAGFQNAYPNGSSGRTLAFDLAELSFAPAAVDSQHGVRAIRAQIKFKVRVLDAAGAEVAIVTGRVEAPEANTAPRSESMTTNVRKAVEVLFEAITAKMNEGT